MSIFTKIFGSKPNADQGADGSAGKISPEPGEGNFSAALAMHLRDDLEPALSIYSALAEGIPEDPLAPFFAAAIKAASGNTVEAAESLRSLSRQISGTGDSISNAILLALVAQVGEGTSRVKIPAVAELIVSFGDLLKAAGFLQESAVCFEIAARLVPDHANVLHKLGDTLHDLRVYDYAESVLLEALQQAPNHWGALYTYAVLLQDLGRDEEALEYYQRAVTLIPDHASSHNNYGAALLRTNRLAEALAHCSRAAELDPDSPLVKNNLGNIYFLMQEHETARKCFAEAISLNDKLAPAYFGLASVEQALGSDLEVVRELYLKALAINPSIPEAHHALGNLLAKVGNPEALLHFAAALQLATNLRNLRRDFGHACLQMGRREEALHHLKMALQQDPDDLAVREMLASIEAEPSA